MPVELAPLVELPVPARSPAIYPPRKRWTRAECERIEATGLWDRDRVELIGGELIVKMSKNRPHMIVLVSVLEWLAGVFGMKHLNPEGPIDVAPEDNPTSEPEPDIAVLAKTASEYRGGNPSASEVRLVVEISDTTLAFDLGPKARLYARAGIPEYWVFDIAGRRLIVHRDPRAGGYLTVTAYAEGESVAPLASPGESFAVAAAFPFPPEQVPVRDLL
jgi:Uma2 family endonuclease